MTIELKDTFGIQLDQIELKRRTKQDRQNTHTHRERERDRYTHAHIHTGMMVKPRLTQ